MAENSFYSTRYTPPHNYIPFNAVDYSFLGTANLADISADAISSTKAGPFVTSVGQTGDGTV